MFYSLLKKLIREVTCSDTTLCASVSAQVFQATLDEANAILNDNTLTWDQDQKKIDAAVNVLRDAYRALVPVADSPITASEQNKSAATGDAGASPIAALLAAVATSVLKRKSETRKGIRFQSRAPSFYCVNKWLKAI